MLDLLLAALGGAALGFVAGHWLGKRLGRRAPLRLVTRVAAPAHDPNLAAFAQRYGQRGP